MIKINASSVVAVLLGCSCLALTTDAQALRYGRLAGATGFAAGTGGQSNKCFFADGNGDILRIQPNDCNRQYENWFMPIPTEYRQNPQTFNVWVNVMTVAPNMWIWLNSYYKDGTPYSQNTIANAITGQNLLTVSVPSDGSMVAIVALRDGEKVNSFAWEYNY